jgi:bacteriorhodopsin
MKNRAIPKTGEQLKKIKRNSNWVFLIIILIVCLTFYLMTIFRMMS